MASQTPQAPWHFLNFFPDPHQHGSFRPISFSRSSFTTVSTTSRGGAPLPPPFGRAVPSVTLTPPPAATSCSAEGCASGVPPE